MKDSTSPGLRVLHIFLLGRCIFLLIIVILRTYKYIKNSRSPGLWGKDSFCTFSHLGVPLAKQLIAIFLLLAIFGGDFSRI